MIPKLIPYTGNKQTRLKDIFEHIPESNTFYEPFGGSGVVGFNALNSGLCKKYIYSDVRFQLVELIQYLITNPNSHIEIGFKDLEYDNTEEDYYRLRSDYNKSKSPILLYLLISRSFSNDMRFNKKHEFNLPTGNRNNMNTETIKIYNQLKSIEFYTDSYQNVADQAKPGDFVFIDPPYYITSATYNSAWSLQDDLDLLKFMEYLDSSGVKWMLTNVTHNRGKTNRHLIDWVEKFGWSTLTIDKSYNNCGGYKSKEKTVEIIVMNY